MSVTLFQLDKSDLVNTSRSAAGGPALTLGYAWQLVADKLCAYNGPFLHEYDSPLSPSEESGRAGSQCFVEAPLHLTRARLVLCPSPRAQRGRDPCLGAPDPPPPASSLASRRRCTQTAVSSGSGVTHGWGVSKHIPTSGVWTPACLGPRLSRWPHPTTEASPVPSPDLSRAVPPAVALSL